MITVSEIDCRCFIVSLSSGSANKQSGRIRSKVSDGADNAFSLQNMNTCEITKTSTDALVVLGKHFGMNLTTL